MTLSCITRSRFARIASMGLFLLSISALAHGQAASTATRPADLYVYGGYDFTQPDWGLPGQNDNGFTFGGAYIRNFRLLHRDVGLGLDVRYNYVTGKVVDEHAFTGNLEFKTKLLTQKLWVYGTVGYGVGKIPFHYLPDPYDPSYTYDNGPILAGGGGFEYEVTRHFSAKADYQFQNWTLGVNQVIDPSVFTFGVQYRIPFQAWISHGHERD